MQDEQLTTVQRRVLKGLKAGPVAWSNTTMAEADALDELVSKGLVAKSVVPDGPRPATVYQLPENPSCN